MGQASKDESVFLTRISDLPKILNSFLNIVVVETPSRTFTLAPVSDFCIAAAPLSSGSRLAFVAYPFAPICSTTNLSSFNFLISSSSASKYFVTIWIRLRRPVSFSFSSMYNSVHSSRRYVSLRRQIPALSSICLLNLLDFVGLFVQYF